MPSKHFPLLSYLFLWFFAATFFSPSASAMSITTGSTPSSWKRLKDTIDNIGDFKALLNPLKNPTFIVGKNLRKTYVNANPRDGLQGIDTLQTSTVYGDGLVFSIWLTFETEDAYKRSTNGIENFLKIFDACKPAIGNTQTFSNNKQAIFGISISLDGDAADVHKIVKGFQSAVGGILDFPNDFKEDLEALAADPIKFVNSTLGIVKQVRAKFSNASSVPSSTSGDKNEGKHQSDSKRVKPFSAGPLTQQGPLSGFSAVLVRDLMTFADAHDSKALAEKIGDLNLSLFDKQNLLEIIEKRSEEMGNAEGTDEATRHTLNQMGLEMNFMTPVRMSYLRFIDQSANTKIKVLHAGVAYGSCVLEALERAERAQTDISVIANDIDAGHLAIFVKRLPVKYLSKVTIHRGDVSRHLKLESGSLDAIKCANVLHFLGPVDRIRMIKTFNRWNRLDQYSAGKVFLEGASPTLPAKECELEKYFGIDIQKKMKEVSQGGWTNFKGLDETLPASYPFWIPQLITQKIGFKPVGIEFRMQCPEAVGATDVLFSAGGYRIDHKGYFPGDLNFLVGNNSSWEGSYVNQFEGRIFGMVATKKLNFDTTCPKCGEPGTKVCTRCKQTRYCSKDCQASHWEWHKKTCKAPAGTQPLASMESKKGDSVPAAVSAAKETPSQNAGASLGGS